MKMTNTPSCTVLRMRYPFESACCWVRTRWENGGSGFAQLPLRFRFPGSLLVP